MQISPAFLGSKKGYISNILLAKLIEGTRVVKKKFELPKKVVVHNFIVFCNENTRFFYENFAEQSGSLFYFIIPRDVKLLNAPLLGYSRVGNVGEKVVKYLT